MTKSSKFYCIFVCSYIFLFVNTVGKHLQEFGNVIWFDEQGSNLIYWLSGNLIGAFLLAFIIYKIWPHIEFGWKKIIAGSKDVNKQLSEKKVFVSSFVIIFLAWLPCELAYYPGIFDYDVLGQIPQGVIWGYSKGHPLLHTIFLNNIYQLGSLIFKNGNAGVALYTVVQMMSLSACISYAITYLYRQNVNIKVCIGLGVWFAFFPAHAIMAVSTTKDVIFSGVMLVYSILIYDIAIKKNIRNLGPCVLWGIVTTLLRNNMIYAILAFIVIISITKLIVKNRVTIRIWLCICICTILGFGVADMALTRILNASDGPKIEMFSVPLQQLARVYNLGQMEEADQKVLFDLIPQEALNNYRPSLADPVKSNVRGEVLAYNPQLYMELYIKYLIKSPSAYINAFLELTRGMWYLDDESHIWIYGSPNYLEYNIRELPEEWNMPAVKRAVKWEKAKQYYDNMARGERVKDIPIVTWFFAPALYSWLLISAFVFSLYKKNHIAFWLGLPLLYGATLFLGPAVLVRYVYFAFLLVPFVCVLVFNTENKGV